MKFFIFIGAFLFCSTSFANTLVCEKVVGDGVHLENTKAFIHIDNALLSFVKPPGTQPLINMDFVSPYDLPAFQYDRQKECSLSSTRDNRGGIKHEFICRPENGSNLDALLQISADKKSATYTGIIRFPSDATLDFEARFSKCRL